jgi:hypothetical protein
VVPCDMPAHDYHHVHPRPNLCDAIYARQRAVEAGERYTEIWGPLVAIDAVFEELSRMPPVERRSVRSSELTYM